MLFRSSIIGLILNVWGFVLLIDYGVKEERLQNLLYFGGVALATSGAAWFFTGMGVYYSQKITEFSNQARNRRGVFLGFFNLADALGRFAGPALIPLFLHFSNPGDPDCQPAKFEGSDKCEVINVNSVLAVLCGIFSFNLLAFIYYHVAHGKRHTHGFLLSETDNPRRIALMEDVYNLPNEERGQPDHTQMDSSPPSQPQRTSLHGSSSYTSSHDGSLQAI